MTLTSWLNLLTLNYSGHSDIWIIIYQEVKKHLLPLSHTSRLWLCVISTYFLKILRFILIQRSDLNGNFKQRYQVYGFWHSILVSEPSIQSKISVPNSPKQSRRKMEVMYFKAYIVCPPRRKTENSKHDI